MINENNTYRMDVGDNDQRAWNMEEITEQLNWMYIKSRNKVNGKPTYKSRKFPGHIIQKGEQRWAKGFRMQDECRRLWNSIQDTGHLPRLYVETKWGEVRLNNDLAEFFIESSQIADNAANGWKFRVE